MKIRRSVCLYIVYNLVIEIEIALFGIFATFEHSRNLCYTHNHTPAKIKCAYTYTYPDLEYVITLRKFMPEL